MKGIRNGNFSIIKHNSKYFVVRASDIMIDKSGNISNLDSIIIADFNKLETAQSYCRAYASVWQDTDFTWLFQRLRVPSEIFFANKKDKENICDMLKKGEIFSRDLQLLVYVYMANIYNKFKKIAYDRANKYGYSVKKLPMKVVQSYKTEVIAKTPYYIQAYNLLLNINLITKVTDIYRLNFDMLRERKQGLMHITKSEKERCKEVMELLRNRGMIHFTMTKLKNLCVEGD